MIIKNNNIDNSKIKVNNYKKRMKGEENWEYIDRAIRGKTDLNENETKNL